jgi:hypothetical protein
VETVYVPATPDIPLIRNAAFIDALNRLAEEHGQEVRFQIVPARPKAGDLMHPRELGTNETGPPRT